MTISELWIDALRAAYSVAKAERLKTLHGDYLRGFDGRGVHVFSEECGRIAQLEAMEPDLACAGFSPPVFRAAAHADADEEYADEIRRRIPFDRIPFDVPQEQAA